MCVVRKTAGFFAGKGLPFAFALHSAFALCKAKGGLPGQIAPSLVGAKPTVETNKQPPR